MRVCIFAIWTRAQLLPLVETLVCIFWSKKNEIWFAMTKWMRPKEKKKRGNRFQHFNRNGHTRWQQQYHCDGATLIFQNDLVWGFTFICSNLLLHIITATDHLAITVNWIAEFFSLYSELSPCVRVAIAWRKTPDSHQSDSPILFKRSHSNFFFLPQPVRWGARDTHSRTIKLNYWQFTRTIFTIPPNHTLLSMHLEYVNFNYIRKSAESRDST